MNPKKLTLALCTLSLAATAAEKRPNVIFVFLDDVGWGYLGAYNGLYDDGQLNAGFIEQVVKNKYTPAQARACLERATPTLNRLCNAGVVFTDAYATASMSSPSRAGVLTSCYQQRFGYYMNDESKSGIPDRFPLMPSHFQKAGYATACIGKYHVAPEITPGASDIIPEQHPTRRGFDYYFGFNAPQSFYYDSKTLSRGMEAAEAEGYLTDQLTSEAISFIDRSGDKPFLIYLPYNAVHGPTNVPAPEVYREPFLKEPAPLQTFYSYLYAVDCGLKRILDHLAARGMDKNTLVVFSSDNGSPGNGNYPLPKNGPFRGFKGQTLQGGLHIPLFMWGAGLKPRRVEQTASLMDVFPTAMEAAGIEQPGHIDGRSLWLLATGRSKEGVRDHLVWMGNFTYFYDFDESTKKTPGGGGFVVRRGDWVARWNYIDRKVELYDIRKDRGEKTDLAATNPAAVAELTALYDKWQAQMQQPVMWRKNQWQPVIDWNK